jgi:hypothetical protein
MISKAGYDELLTEFNLSEASTALVLLELAPSEQAEGCTATLRWDGRGLQSLPRTHLYTVDVGGNW